MIRWILCLVLVPGFRAPARGDREGDGGEIVVSNFETPGWRLPDGWRHQTFDEVVLRGRTRSGAPLVYRRVDVDWRTHPVIAWRWRVEQVFDKDDERAKAGDDTDSSGVSYFADIRFLPEMPHTDNGQPGQANAKENAMG